MLRDSTATADKPVADGLGESVGVGGGTKVSPAPEGDGEDEAPPAGGRGLDAVVLGSEEGPAADPEGLGEPDALGWAEAVTWVIPRRAAAPS
ncbi:MAG TPA: hypothetical protein VIG64_05365 [Actinomycetota bacterium]|jgi:hypothetical protein